VREANDLGHWCRFFLQAVVETAENGKETFKQILVLRQKLEQQVVTLGRRAEKARQLVMHLYRNPAVSVNDVMELLNINKNPARELIAALQELGVLTEITGYRRNRIFYFDQYMEIFREKDDL